MPEEEPKPRPLKDVVVTQAPAYVRELLKDIRITIPIANAYPAICEILNEGLRNIVAATPDRADMPAVVISIDHMQKHFRLFMQQGEIDKRRIEREATEQR